MAGVNDGRARRVAVRVHRWVGLVMAGFLLLAGLTGALLVWYHELDGAINAPLMEVAPPSPGMPPMDGLALRERVQAAYPQAWVHYVSLDQGAAEDARVFYVDAAPGPDGEAATLGFDEVFVNPYTGAILGTRQWGDLSQGLTNLMPFIYRLHYSLALGTVGTWLFGIVALLWTIDCFVGAWLTFPVTARKGRKPAKGWWARWAPAWKVRWASGAYKLNFDIHRAGGLWPWALLFVLAWSSVAFNLHDAVYRPVMEAVFGMQPDPRRALPKLAQPLPEPPLGWEAALASARAHMADQARARGFTVIQEDRVSYDPNKASVRYVVRTDRDVGDKRGQSAVFVDARSGALLGLHLPSGQAAGDTATSWLLSLHMGQVWGLPYRLLLTVTGIAVAALSVTGVVIWWKKRQGRRRRLGAQRVA